ncbi:heparinase II/III-family protein [bacterium]|nr:heparinase II/III-family protein [bacterium]
MKTCLCAAVVLVLLGAMSIITVHADESLESFTYAENFETQELQAWASYPLWQDTAYDPNFRVGMIVPGDPNISIVQKVTPYTNVDTYAGAQKKLDMYMTPGVTISLRFYLKSNLPVEFLKIRLAAGDDGKVDYTITDPATNRWEWITVSYNDLILENPRLAGKKAVPVYALAVLVKIPDADPEMPFYLGLDDITFKGARAVHFKFAEPVMHKLSEWAPYIPDRHYRKGETFTVRGQWPLDADRATITVTPFTERTKEVYTAELRKKGNEWSAAFTLSFPEGLYHADLRAYDGKKILSGTECTFYIAPENLGRNHPRVWFDSEGKKRVEARLKSERFKQVADNILKQARDTRENNPLDSIIFEIDQFNTVLHTGNQLPSIYPWFDRLRVWRQGVYYSAFAYGLLGDNEAGEYGKNLMIKLGAFPYWLHPWFIERGRHIYYPIGEFGMELAVGYDLLYDLMSENERKIIRDAMMKNVVVGCHKGYVEDNLVTNNTSNWVAHITGGSLMCQAAIYGDDTGLGDLEPYFTGAILKDYDLIQKVFDSDGSQGEGYGYYDFSMYSWSYSLPAVENVFKIDMSGKIDRSYAELIWAGIVKKKKAFFFGDSDSEITELTNWAWLLDKYKDPQLGWLYNFLKYDVSYGPETKTADAPSAKNARETFMDALYETWDVPKKPPFDEPPVRVFRDVGITVFKSGWEPDDFVFVMHTGAFYNHQHLDQGSFWLSDRGSSFIEERHGASYYTDPLYQSWYTQPIGHSTILIDHNHQSQRVGDPLEMAKGFDDYAFLYHFLDGKSAAFSSGDIGRLYWGKVKEMRRNVLYLKPRTLLMIDTVIPEDNDVDVTLLYQTPFLKNIAAGNDLSGITIDGKTLNIAHLCPEQREIAAVETPHYTETLMNEKPLEREGMLTVTSRTTGVPLVLANILKTTDGGKPDIQAVKGGNCMYGSIDGVPFAFSTRPGAVYHFGSLDTDACAITEQGATVFAAVCTTLSRDSGLLLDAKKPVTCEIGERTVKYYHRTTGTVALGAGSRPSQVILNGKRVTEWTYDLERKACIIELPAGEGTVVFQ